MKKYFILVVEYSFENHHNGDDVNCKLRFICDGFYAYNDFGDILFKSNKNAIKDYIHNLQNFYNYTGYYKEDIKNNEFIENLINTKKTEIKILNKQLEKINESIKFLKKLK